MLIDKIFDRITIKHITKYLAISHLLIYLSITISGQQYLLNHLRLIPNNLFKGEIWRIFTFMVIPDLSSPISFILSLIIMWWAGVNLENLWGKIRFNQLLFLLWLCIVCLSFLTPLYEASSNIIFSVIFTIFCFSFPDLILYLFFIIPCKLKIIGIINLLSISFTLFHSNFLLKLSILFPLIIGFIFFKKFNNPRFFNKNYKNYKRSSKPQTAFHHCNTCQCSELTDKNLQFRVCSKCNNEFCLDHLPNHQCK
ncbi:MAG: hypothetical protein ACRC37_02110 [Lentisphaeria bacterium]